MSRQSAMSITHNYMPLEVLYQKLLAWFRHHKHAVVAFSGGVDSTLVLKAAIDSLGPENVLAVTADSPSLPRSELDDAKQYVRLLGAKHLIVKTKELDNPAYIRNHSDRCYHCKQAFYAAVLREAETFCKKLSEEEQGASVGRGSSVIVDGNNADDLSDTRPGLRAADEAGVKHPFVELGIGKMTVRELSRFCSLPSSDKPEMACLASRIPTGTKVDEKNLAMVESAEAELNKLGFSGARVRYHELGFGQAAGSLSAHSAPSFLARIELDPAKIHEMTAPETRQKIVEAVKQAGFHYVVIDLEGYKKGGVPRSAV
jgi:pyridinium-3,5-biscarboxylic acid mononucleotide sulfurtransferase